MKELSTPWRLAVWFILLAAVVAVITPIMFLGLNSFKTEAEILGRVTFWPNSPTLDNYLQLWQSSHQAPIFRWFFNSVMVSSCVTGLVLLLDSTAAFALARLPLRGKRILFTVIVATLFVPIHVILVPLYLMLETMGMIDTMWALILPPGAGAFGVFMLYQFMCNMPGALEDAARIDGCSSWGVYRNVALPLCKPVMAVLAIFTFNGAWNEFLGPLILTDSLSMRTLPVGLAIFQSAYVTHFGLTMAACVVSTLPVLVVFLLFQRHIVEGIALTGFK